MRNLSTSTEHWMPQDGMPESRLTGFQAPHICPNPCAHLKTENRVSVVEFDFRDFRTRARHFKGKCAAEKQSILD